MKIIAEFLYSVRRRTSNLEECVASSSPQKIWIIMFWDVFWVVLKRTRWAVVFDDYKLVREIPMLP